MTVVFLDTETLGLDPDHHPVWEVGLITPSGWCPVHEHEWQIKVTGRERSLAHPKALEVSRFDDRYSEKRAQDPATVARLIHNMIPAGAHLAGAVVSFDEERLRRLLWRHGYQPRWHYHLIDVEGLAAGKVGMAPPWDSEELSRAVGVEPDRFHRHTALGDARWAKAVYEAVLGGEGHHAE